MNAPATPEIMLTKGLDYYKPTMSQHHFEHHPDVEVTFTFKNRGEQRLADYIDSDVLQARFDALRDKSWTDDELSYFASLKRSNDTPVFSKDYLDYLGSSLLPEVQVAYDETIDDLVIVTTGDAPLVTFWETVVMSEVNEIYFEGYMQAKGIDPMHLYKEGDRRLTDKIKILQQNPAIKFSEFGTRRHFSYKWQKHVTQRVMNECPENFSGTSNLAISRDFETTPIGTWAHEMPMIYAGIADARGEDIHASHNNFIVDWRSLYGDDLSTVLTDTFGSDFFFEDFTLEQAHEWKALRHDSGDPIEFGEKAIAYYQANGIDPTTKAIVFSDGLDIDTIVKLHNHFKGRIGNVYGWGTTLTNDLGLKPLNIVMKATHVRLPGGQEAELVKLSDNEGKHTGPPELIKRYQTIFSTVQQLLKQDVIAC